MGKRRHRVNATGRNEQDDQYANISYSFWKSVAWRNLGGASIKVWCELRCRFNGGNNGKISLSLDEAARILHIGKGTAHRGLQELEAKGFIVMTRKGRWYGRLATLWRLTDKPCDGHQPTNDWKRWQPPEKLEIGSEAEHIVMPMVPNQNRAEKIWTATEPVRPH